MAKLIHTMLRVLDPQRSLRFYQNAFGFTESHRLAFPDFTLIYLRGADGDAEIELTHNHDRNEPYSHGDGYGHCAFAVDDLDAEHRRFDDLGYRPTPLKVLDAGSGTPARFFFVTDPDGYKIEVLQRSGHYR